MVLESEWPSQLFLLPATTPLPKDSVVNNVSGPCAGSFECVGRAYMGMVYPQKIPTEEALNGASAAESSPEDILLRERLVRFNVKLDDFYGLLGLEDLKFASTEKDVKRVWKVAAMVCHPDKATPEDRKRAELRYKAMQKGVETLLDSTKRKAYDSSLPFDDAIPDPKQGDTPETFYKTYGPVFARNSRFTMTRPVPVLGDADTDYEKVTKFYDFWLGFKSWREFTHEDEEKVDDGTWREEKRRIQRSNAKLRAGKKKEEVQRVHKLVEDAMKKDPRVQERAKAAADEKEKKKTEKVEKRLAAVRDKKEAEEKAIREATELADREKNAKRDAKAYKNQLKKSRTRFRKLSKVVMEAEVHLVDRTAPLDDDDIELLCSTCDLPTLMGLVKAMKDDAEKEDQQVCYVMLAGEVKKIKDAVQAEKDRVVAVAEAAAAEAAEANKERPWTEEEQRLLDRAMKKSRGGGKDWEGIAFTINQVKEIPTDKDRVIKEIIKRSKLINPPTVKSVIVEEKKEEPAPEEKKEVAKAPTKGKKPAGKALPPLPEVPWGRPGNNVKIGLVGMPNVGKSSTFNLLGNLQVPAENFPFCTIKPSTTIVPVPDPRFDHLVTDWVPTSKIPAVLTVTDIAGLVRGASEGQGLGNEFLANIQAVDAIYHVSRAFVDKEVEHVEGDVNPVRDFEIINGELVKKDCEWVGNALAALKKKTRNKAEKEEKAQLDILERALAHLQAGKEIRHGNWKGKDIMFLNTLNLLSAKPVVYLVNISSKNFMSLKNKWFKDIKTWLKENAPMDKLIPYSVTFEQELTLMEPAERVKHLKACKTQSMMGRIIAAGFKALRCINFFTTGTDEVRAWTVREGVLAPNAAGVIHGDIEKTFINAEVYAYDDFKELGSEKACKDKGKCRAQGKNYVIKDGDIVFFSSGAGKKKCK